MIRLLTLLTILGSLLPAVSHAATFDEDFSAGAELCVWRKSQNQTLYTMVDSNGEMRFSKPAGGAFTFQYIALDFLGSIQGDFDVSIAFRNASIDRVNGSPANQIQLNVQFGGQYYTVVREDAAGIGDNYHVYADPPVAGYGTTPTSGTSGVLRIKRVGTTVTGYFNNTVVHSANYNSGPVTRLWLSLQNNGTTDATAVTFDDFHLTASVITMPACFEDNFNTGVSPCDWTVTSNQPLYTMDDSFGDVRFSKPVGGTQTFQAISLDFLGSVQGDFDVSVDFRDASINRVNGTPANQVQLNAMFGGQLFAVVRDDDIVSGDNCHVYIDPPQIWQGLVATAANAGTLRIARRGSRVTGYYNGFLFHTNIYNGLPVTRIWLSLQNNGTTDATAVTFDNFVLTGQVIVPGVCPAGTIAGTISADCSAPETGLLGVLVDAYEVGSGDLAGSDTTDASGAYSIPDLPVGDYVVTVVVPLGYTAPAPEVPVTVASGANNVDVTLDCLPIANDAQGMGFWKHQVGVATGGNGSAEVDATTLCGYLDIIEAHFNSNALNQVVVYDPPANATCADKLLVARELLNLKGNVGMTARARQHLMSLLLNVAGGYLTLTNSVSEDGATVSQAITYCDQLLDDGDPANDSLARDIAEQVNDGDEIAAGVIPLTTDDIAYAPLGQNRVGYVFALEGAYPNPFNPSTTVAYSLASAGAVRVSIYDVRGTLVRTLVDGSRPAGRSTVTWDGTDTAGAPAASGIYLVRLQSAGKTETKKIALLK